MLEYYNTTGSPLKHLKSETTRLGLTNIYPVFNIGYYCLKSWKCIETRDRYYKRVKCIMRLYDDPGVIKRFAIWNYNKRDPIDNVIFYNTINTLHKIVIYERLAYKFRYLARKTRQWKVLEQKLGEDIAWTIIKFT